MYDTFKPFLKERVNKIHYYFNRRQALRMIRDNQHYWYLNSKSVMLQVSVEDLKIIVMLFFP